MEKSKIIRTLGLLLILSQCIYSCKNISDSSGQKIIFLHHSTGEIIYSGDSPSFINRAVNKASTSLAERLFQKGLLPDLIANYNKEQGKDLSIKRISFPKEKPYGWNNYPYDYYNIWVRHAGEIPFMEEPTLEILTEEYQTIIFKHCFPVSNIGPDQDTADINSSYKSIANYKLQYEALKDKIHSFPDTKFILFTGAAVVKGDITEDAAERARIFFDWVKTDWDVPGDNIYIWDLYALETEGGLYLKNEYAVSATDSHPNKEFASKVSQLLFNRIIDVIENDGKNTSLTGVLH